jgi:hypothetical protein
MQEPPYSNGYSSPNSIDIDVQDSKGLTEKISNIIEQQIFFISKYQVGIQDVRFNRQQQILYSYSTDDEFQMFKARNCGFIRRHVELHQKDFPFHSHCSTKASP